MKKNQKLPQFVDKNSVVKFEFNNLTHIVLQNVGQKNNTTFWNATMNSALIMKYHIGSQAKTQKQAFGELVAPVFNAGLC